MAVDTRPPEPDHLGSKASSDAQKLRQADSCFLTWRTGLTTAPASQRCRADERMTTHQELRRASLALIKPLSHMLPEMGKPPEDGRGLSAPMAAGHPATITLPWPSRPKALGASASRSLGSLGPGMTEEREARFSVRGA